MNVIVKATRKEIQDGLRDRANIEILNSLSNEEFSQLLSTLGFYLLTELNGYFEEYFETSTEVKRASSISIQNQ